MPSNSDLAATSPGLDAAIAKPHRADAAWLRAAIEEAHKIKGGGRWSGRR